MIKTYVWGAVTAAEATHKYLTRYQPKLSATLTTDQVTCLVNLIAALATFLACVTKPAKVN